MAIPSSILAWRIPWTEGPGELQSMGSQRVGHNWVTNTHTHTHTHTHVAWGISVLWPQIESRPQQWKPGNPNHYATGELPQGDLFSELENGEGKPGLMSPETRVSMRLYKTILRARLSDTCNFSTTCLSRATE